MKEKVSQMAEVMKEETQKSLKEIQGNVNKLETRLMETQKTLKEMQENKAQEIEANKEERQKT